MGKCARNVPTNVKHMLDANTLHVVSLPIGQWRILAATCNVAIVFARDSCSIWHRNVAKYQYVTATVTSLLASTRIQITTTAYF